jgi:hypothetical protein
MIALRWVIAAFPLVFIACTTPVSVFCLPPDPPDPLRPEAWLWVGPKNLAPLCPERARLPLFEGYSGLTVAPHTCPACDCGPSATTCTGPLEWEAVAAPCEGAPGASTTPFDAPAGWDGICSTTAKIQAEKTCTGGVYCAQSVVVQPPEAVGSSCTPVTIGEGNKPEPTPAMFVRGCQNDPEDPADCKADRGAYRFCQVLPDPAEECPDDLPDRYEVFQDTTDERTCTPCTCGPPTGGACTTKVGVYADEVCEAPAGSAYVASNGPPICFDVPDGAALLGKTAEEVSSSPGSCKPSGGEPVGEVVPAQPVTWCCYRRGE